MKRLINTPVGETVEINGKQYRAEESIFGCASCDLGDPANGCSCNNVVCLAPDRVFKQVENAEFERDERFDEDIAVYDTKGCLHGLFLIVVGSLAFWAIVVLGINFLISIVK